MKKINFLFLAILIVYLPFQRFFQTLFERVDGLSLGSAFWLSHWYEPVLIILILATAFHQIYSKKLAFSWPQISAFLLIIFGIISIFFVSESTGRGVEGFRLVMFAVLAFLYTSLTGFTEKQKKTLALIFVIVSLFVAAWAIIERLFPPNYWSAWGVFDQNVPYWYGGSMAAKVYQSTSFVGGANQLGAYLLISFFLLLCDSQKLVSSKRIKFFAILVLLAAITVTFSRSAFLGLAIGFAVYSFVGATSKVRYYFLLFLALLVITLGSVYYFGSGEVKEFFLHGASQEGHVTAFRESMSELKNRAGEPTILLFGSGLGTAGPLVIKYGGLLPESWYLQILFELGVLGLLLWLAFIVFLLINLYKKNIGLFVSLVSVSIATIFLHTFSDSPAMSISILILAGLFVTALSSKGLKNEQ